MLVLSCRQHSFVSLYGSHTAGCRKSHTVQGQPTTSTSFRMLEYSSQDMAEKSLLIHESVNVSSTAVVICLVPDRNDRKHHARSVTAALQ